MPNSKIGTHDPIYAKICDNMFLHQQTDEDCLTASVTERKNSLAALPIVSPSIDGNPDGPLPQKSRRCPDKEDQVVPGIK